MTALPMTGFHRARITPYGKQCFRNTAIFRILPASVQSQIHRLRGAADSFHVRDSHPIPLFSEQECVSDCSGRAFATKAMLCNFRYNCSRFLRIKLRKARFLRETLHKEFPLFSPKTGTTPLKKLLFFINFSPKNTLFYPKLSHPGRPFVNFQQPFAGHKATTGKLQNAIGSCPDAARME